jgi:hypothetical protein
MTGSHSITAVYSGDSNFVGATSAAINQTVGTAYSITQLAINTSPSMIGTPVTFNALINTGGMTPTTSAANFFDNGSSIGTGPITTVQTTNLLFYSDNLNGGSAWTANNATIYSGPSIAGPATETSQFTSTGATGYVTQTVSGLTASAPATLSAWLMVPGSSGQSVSLKITNTSGTPLGSQSCNANGSQWTRCAVSITTGAGITSVMAQVGFVPSGVQVQMWGAQVEAAATAGPYVHTDGAALTGSGGTATLTLSNLQAGSHPITAQYPGDPNVGASTSNTSILVITADSSTSVAVVSGTNPSTYKGSVTFTASVTPVSGITPTGTITFYDGATALGSSALSSGSAALTVSTLTAGGHSITAQYGGDSNYNGGTSPVLTQTVNKAASTITVSSNGSPSVFGGNVTFTATVPSDATGTVTFKDGSTTLGTGTISGGTATLTTNALLGGSNTIVASWPGDSNYNAPTNATMTQVVNQAAVTIAVSGVPNPSTYGQSVTMTIVLTPINGVIPTGTVSVADGATVLNPAVAIDGTGHATFSSAALVAGSHTINVTYSGDSNYK